MNRSHLRKIMLLPLLVLLAACGEKAEVPPAHVGKILTPEGYREGTVVPSKFRLEPCMAYCDRLILLEAADRGINENMQLFMPKDQLNMTFDIRATISVSNDKNTVDSIFDRVIAGDDGKISLSEVYNTYAQQKFRSVSRSVLSKYSINDVASNREAVEAELAESLKKALSPTPVKLLQIGLADVQFPQIIVKAKEIAKERQVEIEKAEAERIILLKKAEVELELAKKDRAVRLEKARTIKDENDLTAQSVTPEYLQYKKLEVLEQVAQSGKAIYVPMDSDLVLVGEGVKSPVIPTR